VLAYGDAWIPNYGFPDVMDKIVELRERSGGREIPVIAFGVPADPAKLAELEEAGVKRAVHWLRRAAERLSFRPKASLILPMFAGAIHVQPAIHDNRPEI